MAYWLLKTEPDCYSWDDLARDKKTVWDGVTNAQALKHMRSMKKGDWVLIDRKSTRLNSSHSQISYAVFCLKKKIIRRLLFLCIRRRLRGIISKTMYRP